jgi:hypothetical protein
VIFADAAIEAESGVKKVFLRRRLTTHHIGVPLRDASEALAMGAFYNIYYQVVLFINKG